LRRLPRRDDGYVGEAAEGAGAGGATDELARGSGCGPLAVIHGRRARRPRIGRFVDVWSAETASA